MTETTCINQEILAAIDAIGRYDTWVLMARQIDALPDGETKDAYRRMFRDLCIGVVLQTDPTMAAAATDETVGPVFGRLLDELDPVHWAMEQSFTGMNKIVADLQFKPLRRWYHRFMPG